MRPILTRTAPVGTTTRGPVRSMSIPMAGVMRADIINPIEKVAARVPRLHPNSSKIGGNNREKAVREFTPIPIVIKATVTTTHP